MNCNPKLSSATIVSFSLLVLVSAILKKVKCMKIYSVGGIRGIRDQSQTVARPDDFMSEGAQPYQLATRLIHMGTTTMTQSGNMLQLVSRSLFVLLLFFQLSNYVDSLAEDSPETVFCQRFVRSKGYLCEEHKMYTEDGFELLLHRVRIVPAESEGRSDDKEGDIQYNLKVALSHRMREKGKSISRLNSELKHTESSNTFSEVHITEDFVSERAQPFLPYDLAKTHSDSRSSHREQGRRVHWPRSSDARDLPENLPLDLPPSSVEFPAVTIDPQLSNAHPMKPLEPTLLPTTVASNPYTTFDRPALDSPTAAPIWSEPGETQLLSPEASTLALPPLWYIPGVTQPPGQSEPSDPPGPTLLTDEPLTPIFSPELPPDIIIPETLPPAIPDPTTISTIAPSLPELPSDSAFPGPVSPASSRSEMAGQLPGPVLNQPPPELGPVAPGDLPRSPAPMEWVKPRLGSEGPASGIAAAPVEGDKRCRPVLLLHHELLNGDVWFTEVDRNGPNHLLPFILADDGFDVWVGHERATFWSRDHTRLSSSDLEYWDWTWDDFVDHDLPIILTHINAITHSKIHLVGVSQSAAVAVAASAQQAVASLIKSLVLLGPSIYHGNVGLQQLQTWAQLFAQLIDMTRPDPSLFLGQFNISRNFGMHNWSLGGPSSLITGPDCCISKSLTLFANGWDGTTSYKNFQHFEQGILTNTFQRFDYGSASRNLEAYGQTTPPAYSPANIPVDIPVLIIFAGNDFFSPPKGVQELLLAMQKLPVKVYLPLYAHFDLLYSSRRYQDVYVPVLSFIRDSAQAT